MNKDTYSGLRFPLRQGKRAVLREAAYFGCPNKLSSRFSHAHARVCGAVSFSISPMRFIRGLIFWSHDCEAFSRFKATLSLPVT